MGLHTRTNPRLNFETSNRAKLQENIKADSQGKRSLANYGCSFNKEANLTGAI